MKVPPPKNLIVRAKPSQTIVRQSVLAAVSYVSALCGAACAQSDPAAPPLLVSDGITLSYKTEVEKTYKVERSPSLDAWETATPAIFGDGNQVTQLIPVTPSSAAYFRVRMDARPEGGNAPWAIADTTLLLNSTEGPRSFIFNANGSGVMLQGVTNQSFSWSWNRTGTDAGICSVTRASGELEVINFSYLMPGSGGFSSQRSKGGIPSGASTGTFKRVTDSSLTTFMPSDLNGNTLTFSGTGRPDGIAVKDDGTVSTSGPLGSPSTPYTYALKTATSAEFKLNAGSPDTSTYVLTFTGPSCGLYTLQAKRNSVLRRSAAGSFTIAVR